MIEVRPDDDILSPQSHIGAADHRHHVLRAQSLRMASVRDLGAAGREPLKKTKAARLRLRGAALDTRRVGHQGPQPDQRMTPSDVRCGAVIPRRTGTATLKPIICEVSDIAIEPLRADFGDTNRAAFSCSAGRERQGRASRERKGAAQKSASGLAEQRAKGHYWIGQGLVERTVEA